MSEALVAVTSYVVNAAWQLPLFAAAGWGLSRWVKAAGPELQHKIWVAVLVLATLAPATPMFQLYLGQNPSTDRPEGAFVSTAATQGSPVSPGGPYLALPSAAIYLVFGLYAGTVAFFAVRLCRGILATRSLIGNAALAPLEPDYAAMWSTAQERFSVKAAALLRSHEMSSPVTAGFLRPALLLPAGFVENHSPTEFLAAVGHECAHISRADFAKNLFYEAVALLTAFHPVTWFIKSQIAQTREMLCDRMAAERLLDRRAYGESLLQLAAKVPAAMAVPNAMGIFDANILERRIITVMTSLPHVSRIRRYFFGGAAILMLSLSAGLIGSFTQPVQAQSSTPKKQESTPDLSCTFYKNGNPSPGTCAADPKDKANYWCISNAEPSKSQRQIGCEWKVQRAASKKK